MKGREREAPINAAALYRLIVLECWDLTSRRFFASSMSAVTASVRVHVCSGGETASVRVRVMSVHVEDATLHFHLGPEMCGHAGKG